MKKGKRMIAVILYLLSLALLLGLRPKELFDFRQFLLVLAGGVILYLPSMEKEDFGRWKKPDFALFARNTIYASYIETFVLLFLLLYQGPEAGQTQRLEGMRQNAGEDGMFSAVLMQNIALGFRPLLYGICVWIALGGEEKKADRAAVGEEKKGGKIAGNEEKKGGGIAGNEEKKGSGIAGNEEKKGGGIAGNEEKKGSGITADEEKKGGKIAGNEEKKGDRITGTQEKKKDRMEAGAGSCQFFLELGLTRREAEVALQICKGISNKEIAMELHISETTVKKHVSNIFDKLGVKRREEIMGLLFWEKGNGDG